MKFIRFGSLSATKYPRNPGGFPFHHPPRRRGIYAFIYPYADSYLWGWKFPKKEGEPEENCKKRWDEYYRSQKRIFRYTGMLWSHLEAKSLSKGAWSQIHTNDLEKAIKKAKHIDAIADAKACFWVNNRPLSQIANGEGLRTLLKKKDPYRRGLGGCTSVDHLEVFIEQKHLGKIK